jgi:hypothetical protein
MGTTAKRGEVEIAPGTLVHLEAVLDARCLMLPFLYHRALRLILARICGKYIVEKCLEWTVSTLLVIHVDP